MKDFFNGNIVEPSDLERDDFECATIYVLYLHKIEDGTDVLSSTYFALEAAQKVGEYFCYHLSMIYDSYEVAELTGSMDEPEYRKYLVASLLWNLKLFFDEQEKYDETLADLAAFEKIYNADVVMPESWYPILTSYDEIISDLKIESHE